VLAYQRRHEGERVRVVLNFDSEPRRVDLGRGRAVLRTGPGAPRPDGAAELELGPCEGVLALES
jgi:hypothetical protein